MARIPEYDPPDRQITASDKGANAFEQAGRRIGPAYNEAATLQRQAGEARAAIIRQRRWPFDMLQLQRSLEEGEGKSTSKSTASGYGFKVSGDINHLEHEKEGGGSGPSKDTETKPSSRSRLGNDVGATSMAAGALGKLASRMGATGQYHNSNIDPATGLDMNLMAPTPTKVLENGVLVDKNKVGAFDKTHDINGQRAAETWSRTDWNNVDWNDPHNAAKLQDYKNKNGGADPWGHIQDRSEPTGGGGDTPYLSGSPSFGTSASDTDAYAPDSSTVRTGAGSAAPYDFWSDVTSSLGGVLRAGTTGEWPGGSTDYGGGEDTSGYADLTGEGAQ